MLCSARATRSAYTGMCGACGACLWPGSMQSEPLEIVYRCPIGRCPRTVPGPAVTPPLCGVAGEALRWGQL